MIWRLLKADLKHKPLVNAILFLFIVLAMMCCAGGVNNIVTISTAQEDYYRKSNIKDYYALYYYGKDVEELENMFDDFSAVEGYVKEEGIAFSLSQVHSSSSDERARTDFTYALTQSESITVYFDENNEICKEPAKGEILVPNKMVDGKVFVVGEKATIEFGDYEIEVKVAGTFKDALFGSDSLGLSHILMNSEDYESLKENAMNISNRVVLYGFESEDTDLLTTELSDVQRTSVTTFSASILKMANFSSYAVAGMLIVLSVALVGFFTLALSYTVRFTLSMQVKEIGTMKAIGFADKNISSLYGVKYLALTVAGGIIGFALSIPFGRITLSTLRRYIVMETKNPWFINLGCCILVGIMIALGIRKCLKQVNRISPLEAIRSASISDGNGKNKRFSLIAHPSKPSLIISINELFEEKRHYLTQAMCIFVSMAMMLIVVNARNTMSSRNMFTLIGGRPCDLIMEVDSTATVEECEENMHTLQQQFSERGIECTVFADTQGYVWMENGDTRVNQIVFEGINTGVDQLEFLSGSAPQNDKEIALTQITAKELGVNIGDQITLYDGEEKITMLVCGTFQMMFNLGEGARVSESFKFEHAERMNTYIRFDFNGTLNEEEIEEQLDWLKENYPDVKSYDAIEFIDDNIGNVSSILTTLRFAIAVVMVFISALITLLLQYSIIDKEKSEIATMKVIGLKNGWIIKQYLLRLIIVVVPAIILGTVLSYPLSQLTVGMVFRVLGLEKVKFFIKPFENYVFWPCILMATVLTCAFLMSQKIRTITTHQLGETE